MNKEIEKEQKKLAEHLKKLPIEEREKQGLGLMCWLQGYEVGYQSAKQSEQRDKDDGEAVPCS